MDPHAFGEKVTELNPYIRLSLRNPFRHLRGRHMDTIGGREINRDRLDHVFADNHAYVVRCCRLIHPIGENAEGRFFATSVHI